MACASWSEAAPKPSLLRKGKHHTIVLRLSRTTTPQWV